MLLLNLAHRLPAPAWAAVQAIAAALHPHEVRLVGGAVRDLLAQPDQPFAGDVDLCTTATPTEMQAAFAAAHLRAEPTGLAHGTLTVIHGGKGYEITTLRQDVSTDGRRAVVSFTNDWATDAHRRDFTLNALYANLNGHVFDPTGQGLADLHHRTLRFIGNPADRLAEDWLRALRYARFMARFHAPSQPLPPGTETALQHAARHLHTLPAERLQQELEKMLSLSTPGTQWPGCAAAIQLLQQTSLWAALGLPSADTALDFTHADPTTLLPFAATLAGVLWLHPGPLSPALNHARLKPSRAQQNLWQALDAARAQAPTLTPLNARAWGYRQGWATAYIYQRLVTARWPTSPHRDLLKIFSEPAPVFPVTGADLVNLGHTPGPALGDALAQLEAWWLEHNATPDRAACLAYLGNA